MDADFSIMFIFPGFTSTQIFLFLSSCQRSPVLLRLICLQILPGSDGDLLPSVHFNLELFPSPSAALPPSPYLSSACTSSLVVMVICCPAFTSFLPRTQG